jgi:CheY-like chemotaxis protein
MNRAYRILLIDDDPDFSAAVSTYLEANGFTVVRAASGREGVTLAARERPALILLDIIMDERTDGLFTEGALRELPGLARTSVCRRTGCGAPTLRSCESRSIRPICSSASAPCSTFPSRRGIWCVRARGSGGYRSRRG